jgi:hypothetical protein
MPIHRLLEKHLAYGGRALDNSSRYPQIIHDWFINTGV